MQVYTEAYGGGINSNGRNASQAFQNKLLFRWKLVLSGGTKFKKQWATRKFHKEIFEISSERNRLKSIKVWQWVSFRRFWPWSMLRSY